MGEFGQAVRAARKWLRIDQVSLAEKASLSQGMISHLETGRKGPDLEPAAGLVMALVNEALDRRLKGAYITGLTRIRASDAPDRYEMTVKAPGKTISPLTIRGRRTLTKSNPFYSAKADELAMLADFLEVAVDDILHGETGKALSELGPRKPPQIVQDIVGRIQGGRSP